MAGWQAWADYWDSGADVKAPPTGMVGHPAAPLTTSPPEQQIPHAAVARSKPPSRKLIAVLVAILAGVLGLQAWVNHVYGGSDDPSTAERCEQLWTRFQHTPNYRINYPDMDDFVARCEADERVLSGIYNSGR